MKLAHCPQIELRIFYICVKFLLNIYFVCNLRALETYSNRGWNIQDLFERTQEAMAKSRSLHCGKPKHEYPLTGFAVCGYCGSPLVGNCLRGEYRYYHCQATYPTTTREKTCNAHYIRADWLESVVCAKVKNVLENPDLLLAEARKQTEAEQQQVSAGTLDQEIKVLSRKVKGYEGQERRLMSVLRWDVVKSDIVLDELNQMKKELEADKNRLAFLNKTKNNIEKMVDMEAHLKQLCAKIAPDIDNCTYQDKRDAYTYLDLKVVATPEGADIKGYLDPSVIKGDSCLLTIGQTWGCLPSGETEFLIPFLFCFRHTI
jgi:site-specific DNA recombinase